MSAKYTASHSPKIIIIEGPDNIGKGLLIENIKNYNNNIKVIHAGIPDNKDLFNYYYNGFIHDTLDGFYNETLDLLIHDRSMYGEYVYGPKYRNEDKTKVAEILNKLELGQLKTFITSNNLFFILLSSTNIDLLVKNDDGLSYSAKADDIKDELNSFDEIFNMSTIENKKKIYVNNDNKFRDSKDIFNEVINFINSK